MKFCINLLLMLCVVSCSTQRFEYVPIPNSKEPSFSKWNHFFVDGIGQTEVMSVSDAEKQCQALGGLAAVEVKQTFINILAGALTWGIYSPRSMHVYCKQ